MDSERLLAIIATQNRITVGDLDLDSAMSLVVEQARALTGAASAVVEMVDGQVMICRVSRGPAAEYASLRLPVDRSLSGICLRDRRVLRCDDARSDARMDAAIERPGALSMLCAPLIQGERPVGVLKAYDPRPQIFGDEDALTLALLADVIVAQLSRGAGDAARVRSSLHDPLTGLPNRRAFDERLEHEFIRLRRRGGKLCVCKLDLDGFRQLNEAHGNTAGDALLRGVARRLDEVRGDDQAYRYGGDEFALVLLGTDQEGADRAVRRVLYTIEHDPQSLGATLSWGIAYARRSELPEPLVARADEALREMKRARARLRDAG